MSVAGRHGRGIWIAAPILAGAVCALAGQDQADIAVRERVARNIYVTATDGKGAAAHDLTPAEVVVKEDGQIREVLKVAPAEAMMQLALLVDDSGAGIQHVREAVVDFLRVLQRRAEVAIVSTAGQNTVIVDYTADPGALLSGANRLVTRTTSGGYLLEAMQESARTLQRREAARPVIVVLALEGKEYSNVSSAQVLDTVRRSGALVHVVAVGKPSMKTMTSWNQRPTDSIHEALDETLARNTVFAEAPRRSGGRLEQVGQASGIARRMTEIAYELRDQLLVTYSRPADSKAVERLDVSVKRRGLKLRAPKHTS